MIRRDARHCVSTGCLYGNAKEEEIRIHPALRLRSGGAYGYAQGAPTATLRGRLRGNDKEKNIIKI